MVFLNRAATEIFGLTLRLGDTCSICSRLAVPPVSADGKVRRARCLKFDENLQDVPFLAGAGWSSSTPLTVTATPIKGPKKESAGCLAILRRHEELLAPPAVQLQIATLASILENFPMPFFMVNQDLVVTHVNESLERLTGYSRQEAVGRMTCGQLLNTRQCHSCDCILKQVIEQKQPMSGLRRLVRNRHGQEIPVTVSASMITDPSGKIIGGFEAIRDISHIVEAEAKLDLLTERSLEGLLMADENQRLVYVNSRMAEILQQPKEELLGKHLGEVLTSQHLHMALELAHLVDLGQEREYRFCSLLNQPRQEEEEPQIFETCMTVSRLGAKILTCLYLRDLTERIQIERELQKTNTFLHNLIRSSVDGIVVVDTKGVPVLFNEGAERILGYTAEEIIGHPEKLRRFYPPHLAAEMMARMRSNEYGPPDKLNTTQLTLINKNGEEVPVNFSATIIRERGREMGSVGIFSDLREILKVHEELEATHHQLVQAEKIASLGRMAAGVAHEINNPLAGILIYAELLAHGTGPAAYPSARISRSSSTRPCAASRSSIACWTSVISRGAMASHSNPSRRTSTGVPSRSPTSRLSHGASDQGISIDDLALAQGSWYRINVPGVTMPRPSTPPDARKLKTNLNPAVLDWFETRTETLVNRVSAHDVLRHSGLTLKFSGSDREERDPMSFPQRLQPISESIPSHG